MDYRQRDRAIAEQLLQTLYERMLFREGPPDEGWALGEIRRALREANRPANVFNIDGRHARWLRRDLGMPEKLGDLDENTTTELDHLPISVIQDRLHLPRPKWVDWAGPAAFLCGGALTAWIGSYETSDYDFFFPDMTAAEAFRRALEGTDYITMYGYTGSPAAQEAYEAIKQGDRLDEPWLEEHYVEETIRAINFSVDLGDRGYDKIQIVTVLGGDTALDVISTFDLTVSQLGTDGTNIYFKPYTWTDLMRRRLRTDRIHHGISTFRRVIKYSKRGFYACTGTMVNVSQGVIDHPFEDAISLD